MRQIRRNTGLASIRLAVSAVAAVVLVAGFLGCAGGGEGRTSEDGRTLIVFKHGKLVGTDEQFRAILDRFEELHPDVAVIDEVIPSNTDQQHQFYVTNLGGESDDFDVYALDVIWTPEFSRAGWLLPLDDVIDPVEQQEFLPGPIAANTYDGQLYAAPWYVDGGLLYYRSDLLSKHNVAVPETFDELVRSTEFVLDAEEDPELHGFIWQGKQYEGLVCTAMEFIYGNGGAVIEDGAAAISSRRSVQAVAFMRELIERGISPELVTTADEDVTRNIFQSGRALYMRNWPYAWTLFQEDGSPIQGKIGITTMPRFQDGQEASTLGGWQLGINPHSKNIGAAKRFVRFMTSPDAQEQLAIELGYKPSRRSVYLRPRLQQEQPFIVELLSVMEKTQPRPVTPFYPRITQVLQTELSAVVSGLKTPDEAMQNANDEITKILELETSSS